jgi:signal transduction histidine kinase
LNIFISYSRRDSAAALELAKRLRERGMDVWIDQHAIHGATRWTNEIASAIERADAFVLMLTSDAMASENVLKELDLALEWKKRIVPVDLESAPLTRDFMYHLAGLQRVGASDFDAILRAIVPSVAHIDRRPETSTAGAGPLLQRTRQRIASIVHRTFRDWTLLSWFVLGFTLLSVLEVPESILHNGENGEPNASWNQRGERLLLSDITPTGIQEGLREGDALTSFDGFHVGQVADLDRFYTSMKRHRPGDTVTLTVQRAATRLTIRDRLRGNPMADDDWYGTFLLCSVALCAFFYLFWTQPANKQVLMLCLVFNITVLFLAPPFHIPLPRQGIGFPGILTLLGPLIVLGPSFGIQFAAYYLRHPKRRWIIVAGYVIALPQLFSYFYNCIQCLMTSDYASIVPMSSIVPEGLGPGLLLLAAVVLISIGYRQTLDRSIRKRIRIIMWAVAIGCIGVAVFSQLPMLGLLPALPNAHVLMIGVASILIIGSTIGVMKNQGFDTDVLINRSLVYAGVVLGIAGAYAAVLAMLRVAGRKEDPPLMVLLIVILAALFEPGRRILQRVVDKRIFKFTFNYREAEREAAVRLGQWPTYHELGDYIVSLLESILPTDTAGLYLVHDLEIELVTSANPAEPRRYRDMGEQVHRRLVEYGPAAWIRPVGLPDALEADANAVALEDDELRRLGAAVLVPIQREDGALKAFFLAGHKGAQAGRIGWKYSADDVDFLRTLSVLTAQAIARIENISARLEEDVERQRMERLKRLSTITGSTLPHEVWVMGENIRLYRQIELNSLAYGPEPIELDSAVQEAVRSLATDLLTEQFEVNLDLQSGRAQAIVDRQLFAHSVRTLLSHAMKYSGVNRTIEVASRMDADGYRLSVRDHGVGIEPDDLPNIFVPEWRAARGGRFVGSGLGLAVVKHIVEAAGGAVQVDSEIGKGTTVTMSLRMQVSKSA